MMKRVSPKLKRYVLLVMVAVFLLSAAHRLMTQPNRTVANKAQASAVANTDNASGDNTAETLATLTAKVEQVEKQAKQVELANQQLRDKNQSKAADLVTNLKQQIEQFSKATTEKVNNNLAQMQAHIQSLHQQDVSSHYMIQYDEADHSNRIGIVSDLSNDNHVDSDSNDLSHLVDNGSQPKHSVTVPHERHAEEKALNKTTPFITIPVNATLTDSHLMSSIIARIPIDGKVTNPYPFKMILGTSNLAANGIDIPNISGIVASGYTVGDLLLHCARGWVTSMTFVFQDGTIQTVQSQSQSQSAPSTGNNSSPNLGWISDQYGNACIPGKLVSNAALYLSGNVALGVGEGAANSLAQAQTTTTDNPSSGTTTNTITGNLHNYLLGKSLTSGMNSFQQWWHQRVKNSFDAIVIPANSQAGHRMVLNITQSIHIDHKHNGRKVMYAPGIKHNNAQALD